MARKFLVALLLGLSSCGGPGVSPTVVSTPSARESAVAVPSATPLPRPLSRRQQALLRGARSRLGDVYSAAYFTGGYPPAGQSACVDVLVYACREVGVDLRREVARDTSPDYPLRRDSNIDHRWAPNLIVWFRRHWTRLPLDKDFQPGDMVFWNLTGDGVADHCGVVSDRREATGKLAVIHQFPPKCSEEDCLGRWRLVGHFRAP